jgi:hypothetical protein
MKSSTRVGMTIGSIIVGIAIFFAGYSSAHVLNNDTGADNSSSNVRVEQSTSYPLIDQSIHTLNTPSGTATSGAAKEFTPIYSTKILHQSDAQDKQIDESVKKGLTRIDYYSSAYDSTTTIYAISSKNAASQSIRDLHNGDQVKVEGQAYHVSQIITTSPQSDVPVGTFLQTNNGGDVMLVKLAKE